MAETQEQGTRKDGPSDRPGHDKQADKGKDQNKSDERKSN